MANIRVSRNIIWTSKATFETPVVIFTILIEQALPSLSPSLSPSLLPPLYPSPLSLSHNSFPKTSYASILVPKDISLCVKNNKNVGLLVRWVVSVACEVGGADVLSEQAQSTSHCWWVWLSSCCANLRIWCVCKIKICKKYIFAKIFLSDIYEPKIFLPNARTDWN